MPANSLLQQVRLQYEPKSPLFLRDPLKALVLPAKGSDTDIDLRVADSFPLTKQLKTLQIFIKEAQRTTPLRVGVVFSGGQASGGHNVIWGLFDALKKMHNESLLFGFLDGPSGIVSNQSVELKDPWLKTYRNQGGFDLIGSGRTKIETPEQLEAAEKTVRALKLNALVIIGGDDSNTNAAILAEYFASHQCETAVIGVPKTIDGDLKNSEIEVSFGFDTATKNYTETIGNIMRDAISAKKYYYFIKLMGRSASHITLECALQTHPNLALIGEEVSQEKMTLEGVVALICDMISMRAKQGKYYGVVLIPEGIIEFIPEFKILVEELNTLLSKHPTSQDPVGKLKSQQEDISQISSMLSDGSKKCFDVLPQAIQAQLLIGRDPHGNVQVSKVETERLFIDLVAAELMGRKTQGTYSGAFSAQPIFCGYEGRSGFPSNFDCDYCYCLGALAAILSNAKASGYMCAIKNLKEPVEKWEGAGVPLTAMMGIETRHGQEKPVITKALVDLLSAPFLLFKKEREKWSAEDDYVNPGPIQFFGVPELTDRITLTLALE